MSFTLKCDTCGRTHDVKPNSHEPVFFIKTVQGDKPENSLTLTLVCHQCRTEEVQTPNINFVIYTKPVAPITPEVLSSWEKDEVQFPRLLCEIMATQENINFLGIANAMDITTEEVIELFDRANTAWETTKAWEAIKNKY
jgi:hypothetical protein